MRKSFKKLRKKRMDQAPLQNKVFEYGFRKKELSLKFLLIIIVSAAFTFTLYTIFYAQISETILGQAISGIHKLVINIVSHINSEMSLLAPSSISLLGLFYVTFFGGLFFLTIPVEFSFLGALTTNPPLSVFLITFCGAFLSYTLDYIIGRNFSTFFRRIISIKKFYRTKNVINKYGGWAVIFFNIIGVGSQQTTFILGVFRYNKIRLMILTITGQVIKYSAIITFFYLT